MKKEISSNEIGIDVTNLGNFLNVSKKFIEKFLTKREYNDYLISSNKPKFLASRWTLKEASFKAISNYIDIPFFKIEFSKDDNGKPVCTNIRNLSVSTTYFEDKVCSIALFNVEKNSTKTGKKSEIF